MEDVKICKTIKITSKLSGFICTILKRIVSMGAILQVDNQLEDDCNNSILKPHQGLGKFRHCKNMWRNLKKGWRKERREEGSKLEWKVPELVMSTEIK